MSKDKSVSIVFSSEFLRDVRSAISGAVIAMKNDADDIKVLCELDGMLKREKEVVDKAEREERINKGLEELEDKLDGIRGEIYQLRH